MAKQVLQTQPFYLQAGIDGTQTSIVTSTITDIYGNQITSMPSGVSFLVATIEPRSPSNQESIKITAIADLGAGQVALTVVRKVQAVYPYAPLAGTVPHGNGSECIITNGGLIYEGLASKDEDNVFTAKNTFPSDVDRPVLDADVDATTPEQLVTQGELYRTAIAGAVDASTTQKGIVEEATQTEVDNKTGNGGTGARLFINPVRQRSTKLSDYVLDTGTVNNIVITPSPTVTALSAGQEFSLKVLNTNTNVVTVQIGILAPAPLKKLDGTIDLEAGDIVAGQVIAVQYDGTNFQLLTPVANSSVVQNDIKFGGDGTDGALSISSGTTTIDLAGAQVVTKNYTSISITGTGALAFINPHAQGTMVRLLSRGDVTLTSSATPMIDASGLGAASGIALEVLDNTSHVGGNGTAGAQGPFSGNGGAGGDSNSGGPSFTSAVLPFYTTNAIKLNRRYTQLGAGSSAGTSFKGGDNSTSGVGGAAGTNGRGGGILYMECGGYWNFTTADGISVKGQNGTNGIQGGTWVGNGAGTGGGAGGSGGSGGMFLALYNSLTANTGTVNISGGNGGNGGNGQNAVGYQIGTAANTGGGGGGGTGGAGGGIGGAGGSGGTGGAGATQGTGAAGTSGGVGAGGGGGGGSAAGGTSGAGGNGGNGAVGAGAAGGTAGTGGTGGAGTVAPFPDYAFGGGGGGGGGNGGAEGSALIAKNIWFS